MLWNITNIVRFEYWVEADNASDAIKDAVDRDADETTESWHAVEIDDDDVLDDEEDFDDDEDTEETA
ncbi:hypothetical protein EBT16_04065 [bacterium]|nr:hypothetical protein [bacterium]